VTVHHVGIGQVAESTAPDDIIEMLGLGSCVGIYFYVPGEWAAAAHALLAASDPRKSEQPGKYVDTAVAELLRRATKAGYTKSRLRVAIAGGAQIFTFGDRRPELDVGTRNIEAAHRELASAGLRIEAEDTGGNSPRRASLVVGEGQLEVTQTGRNANARAR
jgi:chemotaxis protein CheD